MSNQDAKPKPKYNYNMTKADVDYETWMKILNKKVERRCGLSYEDLPDRIFTRDAYERGESVNELFENEVLDLLREEGFVDDEE